VGGVWAFTMELAAALAPHDIEVVLATFGGMPSTAQRQEAAQIRNLRLLPSEFKLEWMENPWREVEESGRWLLKLEEGYRPDVVHLNTFGHGRLPWRAPVLLTAHSCVVSWWDAVKREPLPEAWSEYRDRVGQSLRAAAHITTPSHAMLDLLRRNYGLSEGRSTVIANGRSALTYRPAQKESFILTAGRLWDEGKNLTAVVKASRSVPWPVYLAGDRKHESGTESDCGACQWLGPLSANELAKWFARASIYALPARYEPFGLSVLEAALSGCALVLGDIPSLRELWNDGALFVPPDDSGALAEAVQILADDPGFRGQLALRAWVRARAYTPARMAREYLSLYEAITQRRQACAS